MKKLTMLMTAATVAISACAQTNQAPVTRSTLPPSTASASAISKEKQLVREQMKDPSSVQFRNVAGYAIDGHALICGEFNAKNSFGGYTGFKHFTSVAGIMLVDKSQDAGDPMERHFNSKWNKSCKPQ